jgi:ATP-dependent helicase/nuclease subunit B
VKRTRRTGPNAGCLAHLDAGGLVLTADLRQARILRRLHDSARIAAGREAWPTAQVLPLETWLVAAWREAGAANDSLPVALPAVAMRWMWRGLVAADAPSLLDPAEVAARARASWLRLRAHGGDTEGLARWPLTRDQQAFLGWARAMERRLARENACDASDLARRLVADDGLPPPAGPLLLAGFSRPTPAQSALFEALAGGGWQIERPEPPPSGGHAWHHAAADPESERTALIAWLRERLTARPEGVHGLIVPDLASQRGALERALEAALQPALELPGGPRERVFDLAGGPPLAANPVIAIALDALQYALGEADWTVTTRLLRSGHLARDAGELDACARLDVKLRSDGRSHPTQPGALAREARQAGAPHFAAAIEGAATALAGPGRRSAGAWAEAFGDCLAAWGWARELPLESGDWQAANRFGELLRELGMLGALATHLTASQAVAELRELAAAPFQPESGEPSVFVLDGWEEPGLDFDSLWVAGLTAAAFPWPVRVDPFLPIEAQRRLRMPRTTAESCVADAQALLAAWRARAGALVLSWPMREDDTDADGSPLLPASFPELPAPRSFATRAELQCGSSALETVADETAPALDGARAGGGARVLELQSRCPFRAFAELRLHAQPLEEPQAGVDRRLRGQVLHRALERFWSGLGSQAALLALSAEACERRVADAVEEALAQVSPPTTGPRALGLEGDWQRRAIGQLLALERARGPFTVTETERELTGRIGGLELRLRVDRVDEAEGALVVIDYKSGATRGAPWRGARMDAPQLPLYAVLHPRRPAAIALAETGSGGARFLGVGDEAVDIEGVLPAERFPLTEDKEKGFGWRAITERWWAWLDALANDHAAGRAVVDPKLAADTCRHCHLGALCRVEPAGAREVSMAEAGDEA